MEGPFKRTGTVLMVGLLLVGLGGPWLTACAERRGTGTIIGAATGALAGEAIDDDGEEGAVIGAIAGGIAGYAIGRAMEPTDQQKMIAGLKNTPTGETKTWQNPDTGRAFSMKPGHSYDNAAGELCRDFTLETTYQGETDTYYKTGCQTMPEEQWVIKNRNPN